MIKKKLLIFTSDLYEGGVAESSRKLEFILSEYFNVIYCTYDKLPIKKEVKSKVFNLNIPLSLGFQSSSLKKIIFKIIRYPYLIMAILKFLILCAKIKPDVIYSMTYIPNVVAIIVGNILHIPVIISERQDPREDLKYSVLISKVLKSLYKFSSLIHVNSNDMIIAVKEFYSLSNDKIYHIDNFFIKEEIITLSQLPCDFSHGFDRLLVTSGRLSNQKGHWHLLNILKVLNKDNNVGLLLLGDGPLSDSLKELSRTLKISEKCIFLGNVDNPHQYVSKANMFVFTSIWESFGNVLPEAMCLSVPIASTSCKSGPREIIDDGLYGIDLGVLPRYEDSMDNNIDYEILAEKISNVLFENSELVKYKNKSKKGFYRYSHVLAQEKFKSMIEKVL